jgi:hypothetical protein
MEDLIMMKDVTIFTFDEMERIRQDIDSMITDAKDGAYGKTNPQSACDWLMEDLKKFREQFE